MQVFTHSLPTPHQNLAYEQWYFNHFEEETLRLWINPDSVIVGKHQNALAECNFQYCLENNIPVLRRISGGGTVYHDLGNINFSFFRHVEKSKMIDYDRSLVLIKEALINLGFPVTMNKRHDLYLGESKVSGNAQHIRSKRALHHGTILYSTDSEVLRKSIKRIHGKFEDKGVASVRSKIINLKPTKNLGTANQFMNQLLNTLVAKGMTEIAAPNPPDQILDSIIQSSLALDDWNFGYSPKYSFDNETQNWRIHLEVDRGGEITEASITSLINNQKFPTENLIGQKHFYREIKVWVEQHTALSTADQKQILEAMF
ncbi:MAG: biotin/lipoate A/B protein ligase family protein [Salibacteraceae bacterium]